MIKFVTLELCFQVISKNIFGHPTTICDSRNSITSLPALRIFIFYDYLRYKIGSCYCIHGVFKEHFGTKVLTLSEPTR